MWSSRQLDVKIVHSTSYDPWYNLALEETLLNKVLRNQVILYLWQNENTVVIGRNQNAWKECRCKQLEKDGGMLARRLSGGGAVFHDLGNLNFTFLMDKKLYNLENQFRIILDAVKKLGIDAEFSGRNDLVVKGQKFSGNAFYHGPSSVYHHGTLLVDADLAKLTYYLQVSREKISSKGVDSVESRVVNLSGVKPGTTVEAIKSSLEDSFLDFYGGNKEKARGCQVDEDIKNLYEKYASWEWRYGFTPEFDISYYNRFTWGEIDMKFKVEKGQIVTATIFSDAMEAELIQFLAKVLKGIPFRKDAIHAAFDKAAGIGTVEGIIGDLHEWLNTKSV